MEHFDIITQLQEKARLNDWVFIAGNEFYQNIDATLNNYENGQRILAADFTARPTYNGGVISEIRYSGVLMLGAKNDSDGASANLDESFMDKYTKRLKELHEELSLFLSAFVCDNELEISDATFTMEINRFDTNIDFVAAQITILQ